MTCQNLPMVTEMNSGARKDNQTSLLIDATIHIGRSRGIFLAARALFEKGVSFRIARRVLLYANHRRIYQNQVINVGANEFEKITEKSSRWHGRSSGNDVMQPNAMPFLDR